MTQTFPFQQAAATAGYTVLYVLSLVVHAIFMSYVLAGSAWIAVAAIRGQNTDAVGRSGRVSALLRDWMPFVLSGAITAGVAPLLFIQILYPHAFYTANLLLNWRWMIVVPVITASFYLLYLQKSGRLSQWPAMWRVGLSVVIGGCFLFVAFCWTTNHQLMLDSERWPAVHAGSSVVASSTAVICRLLTWVAGTFAVMAAFVRVQLLATPSEGEAGATAEHRALSLAAIGGMLAAAAFSAVYFGQLDRTVVQELTGPSGILWVACIVVGVILQVTSWASGLRGRPDSFARCVLCCVGCLVTLTGVGFIRELIRAVTMQLAGQQPSSEQAAAIGGFALFIVFAIFNVVLITFCIRLVLPAMHQSSASGTSEDQ